MRDREVPEAQASDWLQKGLDLVAKAEIKGVTPGLQDLQVSSVAFMANCRLACFAQLVCFMSRVRAEMSSPG